MRRLVALVLTAAAVLGVLLVAHATTSPGLRLTAAGPDASCLVPSGGRLVPARHVDVERDVPYGADAGTALLLDVYRPRNGAGERPAVLAVHGGGWRTGDKRSMAGRAGELARAGFVVFAPDYRLADAGRPGFPRQERELATAVRYIREHATAYGVDPQRLGAVGSSAGGHLVSLLATTGTGPCTEGTRMAAVVSWSGPLDLTAVGRSRDARLTPMVDAYAGCTYDVCPATWRDASPVAHVSADDPPMLLFNSVDELVPVAETRAMGAALSRAGVPHELVEIPGHRHAMQYVDASRARSIAFLDRVLTGRLARAARR